MLKGKREELEQYPTSKPPLSVSCTGVCVPGAHPIRLSASSDPSRASLDGSLTSPRHLQTPTVSSELNQKRQPCPIKDQKREGGHGGHGICREWDLNRGPHSLLSSAAFGCPPHLTWMISWGGGDLRGWG